LDLNSLSALKGDPSIHQQYVARLRGANNPMTAQLRLIGHNSTLEKADCNALEQAHLREPKY
jgi:hypothetical protein